MIAHLECMALFMLSQEKIPLSTGSIASQRASSSRQVNNDYQDVENEALPHNLLPTTGICRMCCGELDWATMIRAMNARNDAYLKAGALDLETDGSTSSDSPSSAP
ncbi:hypothetical protein EDD11_009107 [Mortierella claussenii]|nr:hypothetical protein EDD11_009107 [Mortierella claussenii]